ncbi:MAG: tetratricopeptide repeat protein [Nitrospirae bacterium]|nr:tetratricopeptide repeat protein [Nitrospirota bacterium]
MPDGNGTPADFTLVTCRSCQVKNRIPKSRMSECPKCGKCGSLLVAPPHPHPAESSGRSSETTSYERSSDRTSDRGAQGRTYESGELIAGRYRVQDVFGGEGKSSMGIVYVCHDREHDRLLALKTVQGRYLDSIKTRDAFKKEALAWIHLEKHPHIVRAYWVREIDHHMFIACEYIAPDAAGRNTLAPYLKSAFSLKRILGWAIQFCHGMEYACSRGVTPHRDIKPDNIMITMDGDVKITDFGLVGLGDKNRSSGEIRDLMQKNQEALTFLAPADRRLVAGSPPWMAPEQFYGVAELRSDIYSFGIVLFQMVNSGELPFQPRRGDSWRVAHREYPLTRISGKGAALERIIQTCLQKHRDKRYDDFSVLRRDLEEVFASEITRKTGELPPAPPHHEDLREADLINKGMSFANLGLIDEGIRNYRESIRLNPGNAYAHYNLGNALAQKGHSADAIREYREAVRIEPDLTAAHFNLGITLFRAGHLEESIAAYSEAIRTDPFFAMGYLNLGVAFQKKGAMAQAIRAFRDAVRIEPDLADANYRLGNALAATDHMDEAICAYREALRAAPGHAEASNNLGAVFIRKNLLDDAIRAYGKAIAVRPEYGDAHYNLGLAFIRKAMLREAVSAFEEFLKHCRQDDNRRGKAGELIKKLRSQADKQHR